MNQHRLKSQNARILQMLQRGPVTPLLALKAVGSFRLSARIYDLKQEGYNIVTTLVQRGGRRIASYRLQLGHA